MSPSLNKIESKFLILFYYKGFYFLHTNIKHLTDESAPVCDPIGVPGKEEDSPVSWSLVKRINTLHVGRKFKHLAGNTK